MAITDIPNPMPTIIPLAEERIYDKQFCTQLTIDASPDKPWVARFTGLPYDGKELIRKDMFNVDLQDIKALAALDPELAQAMGAVLGIIGKYLVMCKSKNIRRVTVDNIAEVLK